MSTNQGEPNEAEARTPADGRAHGAGRNLPAAIGVGVGLGAALVVCLVWFNWGFVVIVAAALTIGSVEVARALATTGRHAAIWPIVAGTLVSVVGAYWTQTSHHPIVPSNTWLLATLGLTVIAALIWRMPGGAEGFVQDASASLFVIAYLPLLGSFVALMLAESHGSLRLVCYLACVIGSDVGGYVLGVIAGRHQMAPTISPKKTWEGLAGSFILGIAVAVVLMTLLLHMSWWLSAILGILLVGVGVCGDLIESLIKRDIGIKDMSHLLPGHGGLMDRLDSLILAAPIAWLVMHIAVPGV